MSVHGAVRRVASALAIFGLCAVAGAAFAQQPAPAGAAAQAAANPVAPEAIQAVKDMGAYLQTLKRFQVRAAVTGERVLADGQKLQHTATASMDVVRPNKLRVRMASPRSELFLWGTPAAPLDKIQSAMNAGQDFVGNDLCDHYAFRQGNFDWQIWIQTGSQPLPRKIVITNRADEARPQSVSLIDWTLKPTFKESAFAFVPPKGATKVEIVTVKTR
jgi:hypothetical protein